MRCVAGGVLCASQGGATRCKAGQGEDVEKKAWPAWKMSVSKRCSLSRGKEPGQDGLTVRWSSLGGFRGRLEWKGQGQKLIRGRGHFRDNCVEHTGRPRREGGGGSEASHGAQLAWGIEIGRLAAAWGGGSRHQIAWPGCSSDVNLEWGCRPAPPWASVPRERQGREG